MLYVAGDGVVQCLCIFGFRVMFVDRTAVISTEIQFQMHCRNGGVEMVKMLQIHLTYYAEVF